MKRPPLVLGGQGRSSSSVRRDASAIVLTILGLVLLAVGLAVGGAS